MHVFDSATIAQLLDWCSNHGVYIDSRLEIKESEDSEAGITVFSREPITNRTALVRISKTAVLSVKSCSSSAQIPPEPYGLGAHLALSLAVYTEILLAENSDWFGYLDSLPRELVDLALFWGVDGILDAHVDESTIVDETSDGLRLIDGKEALSWLTGTELEKELRASPETGQNVVDEIRAYYFSTAEPVVSRLLSSEKPTPPPTMSGFFHAYSLVSSRAFLVDAYHGLAMVPIADVFNHTQENHIHLESDNDVCVVCGSLEECPHDSDANDKDVRSPSGNAIGEGHSASVIAHSRQAKAEDTCDMVSNAPIFAHREVFNTYGEKLTNAALLARYGFALDSNENDCITWDWDDTRTFAAEVLERDSSGRGSRLGPDAFMQFYSQAVELWHAHENSPLAETSLVYRPETDTASTVRTLKDGGGGEHDAGGRALSNAVLCVNGDGKMSDELWLYCALLGAMGNLEIEDMVVHLREVARLLWQLETQMDIEGSDGKCSSDGGSIDGGRRGEGSADQERIQAVVNPLTPIGGLVLDTIRTVLCLCCSRRQSIGKADLQQAGDVGDALDRIPPHMTRTRKAMTEVLSEKSLLESVESSWTSLLDYIS